MAFDTVPSSIDASANNPVTTGSLTPDAPLPLVMTPAAGPIDLAPWLREHAASIVGLLEHHGGILFRGFGVDSPDAFEPVVRALSPTVLEYTERSTPRRRVKGNVYTSTEYPADQEIPPHNENAYSHTWPRHIWFCCQQPAATGGATPIVDSRRVWLDIHPSIRDRFIEKKVMYVRNYSRSVGLAWQEAFQTDDRKAVEAYCATHAIEYEWRDRDRLRTQQVRQAVTMHPVTGESLWFNQAHLFHVSSLPREVGRSLLAVFKDERDLPRHALYGTGEAIEFDALDHIRSVYTRLAVTFAWQQGDVLLLDNMLTAHGRLSFTGPRRVLVSMATPFA